MTWQEELRQLDSALAGGELSANEYRKRRDEILAAASSAQPPSPIIGPPTGPQPVREAEAPEAAQAEAEDSAEVTQVVNVDNVDNGVAESPGEVTQIITDVVKPQANGEPKQAQNVMTDERTAPALQQPQQSQWAALPPTQNAPTSVGTFAPVPQQPMSGPIGGPTPTPLDAQELFTRNQPPRGGRKPWLLPVVVLVVLALAGGAVWFFAFRDSGTDNTATPPTDETTEQAPAELPEPVDITNIELPGDASANTGTMNLTQASELQVIAPSEATLLAGAGAEEVTYSGFVDGSYRYLLYAYKSADRQAAEELTGKILAIQKQLGFQDTSVEGVPTDTVAVTGVTNDQASSVRGVYTYGDTTIQLSLLQIPVGDANEMRVSFQQAMTAVMDAAPPGK